MPRTTSSSAMIPRRWGPCTSPSPSQSSPLRLLMLLQLLLLLTLAFVDPTSAQPGPPTAATPVVPKGPAPVKEGAAIDSNAAALTAADTTVPTDAGLAMANAAAPVAANAATPGGQAVVGQGGNAVVSAGGPIDAGGAVENAEGPGASTAAGANATALNGTSTGGGVKGPPKAAPQPTESGLGAGWTPVNDQATGLAPEFFFALNGGKPGPGTAFLGLCTVRDGLTAPACLGLKDKAVVESANLTESAAWRLFFPGDGEVLIANKAGDAYWTVDAAKRAIGFAADRDTAGRFQLLTNAAKDTIVIKAGDLYVRGNPGKPGEPIGLSPVVVGHSFFFPWKATLALDQAKMLAKRQQVDTAIVAARRKAPTANPAWTAYDLGFVILTNKQFDAFPLSNVTGVDLAMTVDHAVYLMTSPLLLAEFEKTYPSLGRDLPALFDLHAWSQVVKATGGLPWQEMINNLQAMTRTSPTPVRENMLAMILANFYALDVTSKTKLLQFSNPAVALEAHFAASCNLAWLRKGNLTLIELVNRTSFPPLGGNDSGILTAPLPNKTETYWFTKFLSTNISATGPLKISAKSIFPEIALLKHLGPKWVSEHSWIGESIAKHFVKQVTANLAKNNIAGIVQLFKDPVRHQIVQAATMICKPEMRISFCALPGLAKQAKTAAAFLQTTSTPASPLDIRIISNLDLARYTEMTKKEMQTQQMVDAVVKATGEAKRLSDQMFEEIAKKVEDAAIAQMLKSNAQLKQDAVAIHTQVKNSSSFQMQMYGSIVEQQTVLAKSKFDAAMSVRKTYEKKLEELSSTALSSATKNAFFSIAKSALAFGEGVQTFSQSSGLDQMQAGMGMELQFQSMKASLTGWNGAKDLKKMLLDAIPQLEQLTKSIAEKLPQIQKLRQLAMPLANMKNFSNVANETSAFDEEYKKVQRFDMAIAIGQLNNQFSQIANQMCVTIKRPAYPPCVDILKYSNEYFGNIRESVEASNEALNTLGSLIGSANDVSAADESFDAINSRISESGDTIADLQKEWGTNQAAKEAGIFKLRKKDDTDAAFSTLLTFQSKTSYLQMLFWLCARIGVRYAGNVPQVCVDKVMQFLPVQDTELSALISYAPPEEHRIEDAVVTIPTKPQSMNDTGYLDLGKLMNGQSAMFRVPFNFKWLFDHGWITSEETLQKSVIYLQELKLILPPRFTDFEEDVAITFESTGVSDLGPAVPSLRYVQLWSSNLVGRYGTTDNCQGTLEDNPYASCGAQAQQLCVQTSGKTENQQMLVPLFTTFNVTASYTSPSGNAAGFAYRALATPLQLRAFVKLGIMDGSPTAMRSTAATTLTEETGNEVVTGESVVPPKAKGSGGKTTTVQGAGAKVGGVTGAGEALVQTDGSATETTPARLRRLRTAAGATAKRCCPLNQYRQDWTRTDSTKCLPCPPGSVSQMGGLYCVYQYNANGGGATNSAGAPGAPAPSEGAESEGTSESPPSGSPTNKNNNGQGGPSPSANLGGQTTAPPGNTGTKAPVTPTVKPGSSSTPTANPPAGGGGVVAPEQPEAA